MRFNVINYLLGEGFRNVFKNKKSTISSLMIMCATMLIFGLFFVIGENVNAFVENVAEAQEIQVFLKSDATEEQIEQVGTELLEIDGVKNVEYVSKDDALNTMKDMVGENLIKEYEKRNIFPVSYKVTLTDLSLNEDVQDSIKQLDNIDEIVSSNPTIALILKLAKGVRIVTATILVILIVISIAIISNTIKLTVHARRKEISIMKYVGATNSFIRWPFLVEGVVIGIMAGILSVVIIGFTYTFIASKLNQTALLSTMISWQLLSFKQMFNLIITVYLALGIGIGLIGSGISMRKYLDV